MIRTATPDLPFDAWAPIRSQLHPPERVNVAICVNGVGSKATPSAYIVDLMPDLGILQCSQVFPRFTYPKATGGMFDAERIDSPIDNITAESMRELKVRYARADLDRDALFYFCYGILHSPAYKSRFAVDLVKSLPRIPFPDQFGAFEQAGRELASLHLNYDIGPRYELELRPTKEFVKAKLGELQPRHLKLGRSRMRWIGGNTGPREAVRINEFAELHGIPPEAHRYEIEDRTTLEWVMAYLYVRHDKRSGLVNDANAVFEDPLDLVEHLERVVHVGIESGKVIDALPDPFAGVF